MQRQNMWTYGLPIVYILVPADDLVFQKEEIFADTS